MTIGSVVRRILHRRKRPTLYHGFAPNTPNETLCGHELDLDEALSGGIDYWRAARKYRPSEYKQLTCRECRAVVEGDRE